jgi:membrane dipeptidase
VRGLRHLQLLHEKDDNVAPLGDANTGAARLGGLTSIGAEVVRPCNRLGIVVVLAHAHPTTLLAALRVATKPVVVSHTNLDTRAGKNRQFAALMKPRLISNELGQAVAAAGGVVGVWTHLADPLAEWVESAKLMVDAIGIDHVGIGTDTDLLSARVGQGTNRAWPGLTGGFLPALVAELQRQGFGPADIAKITGGNYRGVFGVATAV